MGDNFLNCSIGLLIPFVGTSLGAACVFFMKNNMKEMTTRALTGFAAGVMVAASIWSLLIPAMEQTITGNGKNVILSGIYRILDWNIISFVS